MSRHVINNQAVFSSVTFIVYQEGTYFFQLINPDMFMVTKIQLRPKTCITCILFHSRLQQRSTDSSKTSNKFSTQKIHSSFPFLCSSFIAQIFQTKGKRWPTHLIIVKHFRNNATKLCLYLMFLCNFALGLQTFYLNCL